MTPETHQTEAYILRMTQELATQRWQIVLKPSNGDKPQVFSDLAAAFQFLQDVQTSKKTKKDES